MIKIDIDNKLEKIIEKASEMEFKEIIIEQDKPIIFLRFKNSKLEPHILPSQNKIDINVIEKYAQNLVGIENKDKDNFVKTFVTPQSKILCRAYLFKNQTNKVLNIKLLEHLIDGLKSYVGKIPHVSNENKQIYYQEILKNKPGIVIISSQTENIRKNFIYSIIDELNKNKISKIISFEEPIEQLLSNDNSFIFQMKYFPDSIDYIRFITPDYVFIHQTLNEKILKDALQMANSGIKVFITTANTDSEKNFMSINSFLKEEILGLETFEHLFQYFITLTNDSNGNNYIWKITEDISLKR